jgi:hypothetical protein
MKEAALGKLFKRYRKTAEFNSNDHPAFNQARFEKLVEEEVGKFTSDLPTEADYILMQDLTPVGVKCFFYFLAGVPAVRKITVYEVASDNLHVRLDCEYDVEAEQAPVEPATPELPAPPPEPDYPAAEFK